MVALRKLPQKLEPVCCMPLQTFEALLLYFGACLLRTGIDDHYFVLRSVVVCYVCVSGINNEAFFLSRIPFVLVV